MATTARQARNSRFQRGSAVYTCRVCKHNTRSTGGDGAGVQVCDICYELAGEENHISDYGKPHHSLESLRIELSALDERNGPGTAKRLFPTVWDAAHPPQQQAQPEPEPEPAAPTASQPATQEPQPERRTVDITPTWVGLLPLLLAVIESGTDLGRTEARKELRRMAEAADLWNTSHKNQGAQDDLAHH